MVPQSGDAGLDAYLARDYALVKGMSSRFSAAICAYVLRRQTELGLRGDIAEIGAFEGRFLLALAQVLAEGEMAYGLDTFTWPDDGLLDRFEAHARRVGVASRVQAVKIDSGALDVASFGMVTGGKPLRFIHVDGDHSAGALAHDLELALGALHPQGVLCLDDMLHPAYPFLVNVVADFLARHAQMRLFCVIDREDIVAAPKFLLCRTDAVALYEADLMARFAAYHFEMGADALGHLALVLTPQPRLAEI